MRYFSLLIIFLITLNCQTKKNTDDSYSERIVESKEDNFAISDTLTFDLDDSLVVNNRTQVQYLPKKQSVLFFDNNFNRILVFKIRQPSNHFTRHIPSFNEQKSKKIHGLVYDESKDVVYYKQFFKEGSGIVSYDLKTKKNEVFLFKRRMDNFESRVAPDPFITNSSPIYNSDSTLIFSGILLGEDQEYKDSVRKTFGKINLRTKSVEYFLNYPKEYDKANWAGEAYRFIYTCHFKGDTILISFPASNSLYLLSNDSLLMVNGTNPLQKPEISPLKMDRKTFNKRKTKQMVLDFYTRNYSYQNVIYIPGKKRVARILELPLEERVELHSLYHKPIKLLIFDENFNFLKTVSFPEYLSKDNYFVTEKGIYFYNKSNENENKAQYFLFSDF